MFEQFMNELVGYLLTSRGSGAEVNTINPLVPVMLHCKANKIDRVSQIACSLL